jgi:hypothetical protein
MALPAHLRPQDPQQPIGPYLMKQAYQLTPDFMLGMLLKHLRERIGVSHEDAQWTLSTIEGVQETNDAVVITGDAYESMNFVQSKQ